MSINWIQVEQRVPDSRRPVLTWGHSFTFHGANGRFLGVSKCNIGRNGHKFDNEVGGILPPPRVTYWAEIEGPTFTQPPIPARVTGGK